MKTKIVISAVLSTMATAARLPAETRAAPADFDSKTVESASAMYCEDYTHRKVRRRGLRFYAEWEGSRGPVVRVRVEDEAGGCADDETMGMGLGEEVDENWGLGDWRDDFERFWEDDGFR
ncbi:hypothetical protein CDD80_1857 [Ophiocordyceps camponoti-rufipedis]|uniref:Uncharacterized protein n=1 Tax=Ophiocordyceps camponoti-rufipedis TaxID=2004952 RepID=A0A2C5YD95_9HYPO|nr:hypothetical protein CDD80_1857 [Ophiocordyceps camponoti-rufipedis]